MRKITFGQIFIFLILFGLTLAFAIGTTALALGRLPLGDFRGVILVAGAVLFIYAYGITIYRLFQWVAPLEEGEIPEGSRQESIYHVYVLFFLLLFYPIMRSGFVPAPFMRLFYLALGARLGENTYSQGIIHDPSFVEIGHDSVVGQSALLVPHVIEGRTLAHHRIRIGNNVTIGGHAVVLAGVTIGNGAVIAAGAVVPKGTQIGEEEVWGGVPARLLR